MQRPLIKVLWFLCWFMPWLLCKLCSYITRPWFCQQPHPEYDDGFHKARPGDIVFIRRLYPTPWGYWSHSGLVESVANGGTILHAAEKGVVRVPFQHFKWHREVAILRVDATDEQRQAAIELARREMGKPFTLFNLNLKQQNPPRKYYCSGLIWFVYQHAAGIDLGGGQWITPDDFFHSPHISVMFWHNAKENITQRRGFAS